MGLGFAFGSNHADGKSDLPIAHARCNVICCLAYIIYILGKEDPFAFGAAIRLDDVDRALACIGACAVGPRTP